MLWLEVGKLQGNIKASERSRSSGVTPTNQRQTGEPLNRRGAEKYTREERGEMHMRGTTMPTHQHETLFRLERYALFGGERFYASGGWSDFRGSFPDRSQALSTAFELDKVGKADWWHVVDMETGAIVEKSKFDPQS